MKDLYHELWKLGVLAKTKHNEAAPAQHELAPIFGTTNVAVDHNQLTMEMLKKVALKHDLVCLLHEKPFKGVNGSGKHNNWSISTNTGMNLLEPGETPSDNAQFLLFLCAVIKAVDVYQDALRISVASAGNDHRLGANEAPPAVISIFLGEELTEILDAIEKEQKIGSKEKDVMRVGVHILPKFPKDTSDRNRTSPFAFTGNKFEFRMLGSGASIADTNTAINTAVTEILNEFYDVLSTAEDFNQTLHNLIRDTIKNHKRIFFNGNGYDDAWIKEAEQRGLSNLKSTPDALSHLLDEKNVELYTKNKVFSEKELKSRYEILLESYSKIINIEALTMIDMAKKLIIPAISKYTKDLAATVAIKNSVGVDCGYEKEVSAKLSSLCTEAYRITLDLEEKRTDVSKIKGAYEKAKAYEDVVLSTMNALRKTCDEAEKLTAREYWPMPDYGELLFGIRE